MTQETRPAAASSSPSPWPLRAAVGAGAAGFAALVGYGLGHSLQQALSATPAGSSGGWVGALVGAVVAGVAVPLALWARPPQAPRLARSELQALIGQRSERRRAGKASDGAVGAAGAGQAGSNVVAMPGRGSDRSLDRSLEAVLSAAEARAPRPAAEVPGLPDAQGGAQRSMRDALTGAFTQQHFVAAADREWARIRRHNEDAALLMVDIDHLAAVNAEQGPECGDAVLVEVTRLVSATLRQYDLLARFSGGVLVVYLPHTDPIGALDVAERIRERVAQLRLDWRGRTVKATVSVGVAGIGASHGVLDDVIADAGAALREAKQAGRNCVRAAPIPPRRGAPAGRSEQGRPASPN